MDSGCSQYNVRLNLFVDLDVVVGSDMFGDLIFFFFQAEDGIRDYKVTGAQTCALPISRDRAPLWTGRDRLAGPPARPPARRLRTRAGAGDAGHGRRAASRGPRTDLRDAGGVVMRSEERRVGEEGRSRGSPYH